MTQLYLANCTKQIREFMYRIPGHAKLYELRIHPGSQAPLPHKDLTNDEITEVIRQHEHYGLVPDSKVNNMREFIGMCYSIGKPVDMRRVNQALINNDAALTAQAAVNLSEGLVSADNLVKSHTNGEGSVNTLEITENVAPGDDRKSMTKKLKIAGRK